MPASVKLPPPARSEQNAETKFSSSLFEFFWGRAEQSIPNKLVFVLPEGFEPPITASKAVVISISPRKPYTNLIQILPFLYKSYLKS